MGMADVATVLFTKFMKFDAKAPRWPDRDRFVLSAGHGSMLLYALAYLTGYEDVDIEQIKAFRQLGSRTAGHPEFGHVAIAETTTGPLGQGIGNAVGLALGEAMQTARWGKDVVDHHTYVIVGDGCLMEGVSQEAITLAGHLKLNKLIVLWDDNHICIDGDTSLSTSDNQALRFQAAGWNTLKVDGHDVDAIAAALTQAQNADKPTMIACRTTIGYGAPTKAGSEKAHGSPLGADEIAATRDKLSWPHPPFVIPEDILSVWRQVGSNGASTRAAWEKRLAESGKQKEFLRQNSGALPDGWRRAVTDFKTRIATEKPNWATRKASQEALEVLTAAIPEMVGGSADLTDSNLTDTKACKPIITPGNFAGRYIHYGIREHGMAAAMNGLALHGGFIPYGGTFLIFANYLWPALRMSAMMGQRVLYVLTHDSIGLGEDGPTHQPIETSGSAARHPQRAGVPSLRRRRDHGSLRSRCSTPSGPSVFALSRQNLPTVRTESRFGKSDGASGAMSSPRPRANAKSP